MSQYAKIERALEQKLERQKAAVKETEEHLAAIKKLSAAEAPKR